jgi:hypothetical protein
LLAKGKPRTTDGSSRPWRVRLYAPSSGSNKYQVYFKAPAGDGEPWKRVLRRAASEEEARKIFEQAEAALDHDREAPVGADVRAGRTIRMLGEEYLRDSTERSKQPRTMEGRESRLNAHILPTIGEVPVAKWRVEHSRKVMEKGSKTLFSRRGREDLRGQLAAMRKLAGAWVGSTAASTRSTGSRSAAQMCCMARRRSTSTRGSGPRHGK